MWLTVFLVFFLLYIVVLSAIRRKWPGRQEFNDGLYAIAGLAVGILIAQIVCLLT